MPISVGKNLKTVETDDNFIIDFESNYEEAYNYINEKYPNKIINGEIVGTLTNNNGVISGFSTNDYFKLLQTLNPNNKEWEAVIKFKLSDILTSGWQALLGNNQCEGFNLHVSAGKIKNEFSSNGSSWNIGNIIGSTLTADTDYWARTGWKNNTYYLDLSTNGIDWTSQGTISSSTPMYAITHPFYIGTHYNTSVSPAIWQYLHGSVDLSDCYIKIDNKLVWEGYDYPTLKLYDVLMSFASFVTLQCVGLPTGASIDWFLPEGDSSNTKVDVIKGSLVPYVVTFSDESKYIDYYRANEDWILDCTNMTSNTVILTINPSPDTATVELEVEGANPFDFEQVGNSITVSPGTKVRYTVSKTDYITQSNVIEVNETQTVNIILSETLYTYIIHPTPADATVELTANASYQATYYAWYEDLSSRTLYTLSDDPQVGDDIYSLNNNVFTKAYVVYSRGTNSISVSHGIFTGQRSSTRDETGTAQCTQNGNSISVPTGTTVTWTVSANNYVSQSGTKVVNSNCADNIVLKELLTLTVTPDQQGSTVTLIATGYEQTGNSIQVPYGTTVMWMAEKTGFETKTGSKIVVATDEIYVELKELLTYTIIPDPDTASVSLTAAGYTQVSNSITVPYGTTVNWRVAKEGMETRQGTKIITDNITDTIKLYKHVTITVNPTPNTATVELTAAGYTQVDNSIEVLTDTIVHWKVYKSGYLPKAGTVVAGTDDEIVPVSLAQAVTLTVNPSPSDAIVILTAEGYGQYGNKITIPVNTTVYWTVTKDGYETKFGTESSLSADKTISVTIDPL